LRRLLYNNCRHGNKGLYDNSLPFNLNVSVSARRLPKGTLIVSSPTTVSAMPSSILSSSERTSSPTPSSTTSSTSASTNSMSTTTWSASPTMSGQISTSTTSISSAILPAASASWQALGCYKDGPTDMSIYPYTDVFANDAMAIEICQAFCQNKGTIYAGVEYRYVSKCSIS
jgi:hypothetical protein